LLVENAFKEGRYLMRPPTAWAAMQAHFSAKLREDTMTPMWLEKGQIGKWLAGEVRGKIKESNPPTAEIENSTATIQLGDE
jgi:hypothetical protein